MILQKLVFLLLLLVSGVCQAQNADTLWTYSGKSEWGRSEGAAVCEVADGGFVIVGCADCKQPEPTGLIIKLDTHGKEQWNVSIANTSLKGIIPLSSGDVIVCGQTGGGHFARAYCASITSKGTIGWTRTLGDSAYCEYTGICRNESGIYCAGIRQEEGSVGDFFVTKMDTSGDTLWTRTFQNWDAESVYGITADTIDGAIVFGANHEKHDGVSYVIAVSSYGETRWATFLSDSVNPNTACDAKQTNEGWAVLSRVVKSEWDWEIMLSLLSRSGEILRTDRFRSDSEQGWIALSMAAMQNRKLVIAFSAIVDRSSSQAGLLYLKFNSKMKKVKEIEGGRNYQINRLIFTKTGHIVSCGEVLSRKNYESGSRSEINPQPPDTRLLVMKLKP